MNPFPLPDPNLNPTDAVQRLLAAVRAFQGELAAFAQSFTVQPASYGPPPTTSLLTVDETAAHLRVSRTRVFQLLAGGELKGVRIGKHRCVTRVSIDAFVDRLGDD